MERLTLEERQEVQERYPETYFPDPVLEPIWFGKRPDTRIEGKKAVIDQKTNEVFGICSDIYQIVHYEDLVKMTELTVEQMPEFGNIKITPKVFNGGSKLDIIAKFTDVEYEIKKGDFINPSIHIRSSYDLGWKLTSLFGAFRIVCSNGMTVGNVFSKFARRHVVSLDPSLLRDNILEGMGHYSEQVGLWKDWAETKINALVYKNIWDALPFSDKEKEKIENLPETESKMVLSDKKWRDEASLWDVHSIISQFVTHEIKSELRKAELGPIVANIFESVGKECL